MGEGRKSHAGQHFFLVSDDQNVLLKRFVIHKASPACAEARILLLIGDQAPFEPKTSINGEKQGVNKPEN